MKNKDSTQFNANGIDLIVNGMIDARVLHSILDIGRDFTTWAKSRINTYGFTEGIDFFKQTIMRGERKNVTSYNYFLTNDMAKMLCRIERQNPKASEILTIMYELEGREVVVKEQPRLEYQFEKMLSKITGLCFEKQFPVDGGKYRLDFYIKDLLIVEYDEQHHNNKIIEDLCRMEYCQKWLLENGYNSKECRVIRVKQGHELDGIRKIVEYIYENNMYRQMIS